MFSFGWFSKLSITVNTPLLLIQLPIHLLVIQSTALSGHWGTCSEQSNGDHVLSLVVRQAPQQIIVILCCKCYQSPVKEVKNFVSFSWGEFSLSSYWNIVSYPTAPANLIFPVSSFSLGWPFSVPKDPFL